MMWVMLVLWTFLICGAMVMTWNQVDLDTLLLAWFIGVAILLGGGRLLGGGVRQ